MLLFTFLYYFRIDNGKWDKIVNQIPQAVALGDTNIDNRKKTSVYHTVNGDLHCFTHRKHDDKGYIT